MTEAEFSHCKGRTSPNNRREDVCQSARLFFDNPHDCYLRRPDGKERDRRYWEIFAGSRGSLQNTFPNACLGGECPFAYDMPFLPEFEVINVGEEDGLEDWGKYMRGRYRL